MSYSGPTPPTFIHALMAGAIAGMTVDVALYPLDTIKTRLQAQQGFRQAGGFRGMYRGILPVLIGSAPNAALFFVVYERCKQLLRVSIDDKYATLTHMTAASVAELAACSIRVPIEVVKQRVQTFHQRDGRYGAVHTACIVWREDGWRGFYRGFGTTIMREIPFTCIQFPLYEYLKRTWSRRQEAWLQPWQAALCGSLAGACAASCTTPLDVLKTRIMLSNKASSISTFALARQIIHEEGISVLFRGLVPRVLWISAGGAIFLGAYEKALKELERYTNRW